MHGTKQTDQVHDFLTCADSYPEGPDRIEVMETHISWIYLTHRFAYKRKKPVQFDFLDFSTVDLRERYCALEVALNRRFSPDVYLSVLPIKRNYAGELHFDGHGEIVDWLVKMRRLNDHETLESLMRRRELTDLQVNRLVDHVASFYVSQAPAMVRTIEFRQALKNHIVSNRTDLLAASPERADVIGYASSSQLRYLNLASEYFDRRVCDGCVVDGHGDLRPEHIYLSGTKPLIIDCVEFNPEYRTNDIIDELAFLAMECDRLGYEPVGNQVIDAYSSKSRDVASTHLVNFYKGYRAAVRAKVCGFRGAQMMGTGRAKFVRKMELYLGLAAKYASKLGPKLVIVVQGLMGTGKSTLATALKDPLDATLLQTDVIRKGLHQRNGVKAYGQGKYSGEARSEIYKKMFERMEDALLRCPTVILDGTFGAQEHRERAAAVAKRSGAKLIHVQCACPADIAIDRISERAEKGISASEAAPEYYELQAAEYEPIPAEAKSLEVDTTQPLSQQVEEVLARVHSFVSD